MKVYCVTHLYDNGESYEDRCDYEVNMLYETLDAAKEIYWSSVFREYEGEYILYEWELDTQNRVILEKSPYVTCKPSYLYDECDEYDGDDCMDYQYDNPDPSYSIKEYWRWDDELTAYALSEYDEYDEDDINEWLTHKGENLADLTALEEEKESKLLSELLSLLKSC